MMLWSNIHILIIAIRETGWRELGLGAEQNPTDIVGPRTTKDERGGCMELLSVVFRVLVSHRWPWSHWWLRERRRLMSVGGSVFPMSFVLWPCQFPKWGDDLKMKFMEVMNKVVNPTEISFCPIFILLFGVAWSYWSVKWGRSWEGKFGSCCFRAWVEINYLYTLEGCVGF